MEDEYRAEVFVNRIKHFIQANLSGQLFLSKSEQTMCLPNAPNLAFIFLWYTRKYNDFKANTVFRPGHRKQPDEPDPQRIEQFPWNQKNKTSLNNELFCDSRIVVAATRYFQILHLFSRQHTLTIHQPSQAKPSQPSQPSQIQRQDERVHTKRNQSVHEWRFDKTKKEAKLTNNPGIEKQI